MQAMCTMDDPCRDATALKKLLMELASLLAANIWRLMMVNGSLTLVHDGKPMVNDA